MEKKYNLNDLKDKLINHMMEMDLHTIPLEKLWNYANILCAIKKLEEKTYTDMMAEKLVETVTTAPLVCDTRL